MSRTPSPSREAGFTVLEALISLTIFFVIIGAVLITFSPSQLIYSRGERRTDVQQNARLAMAEMGRQIRMAGYFPENFSASPPSPLMDNPIRMATDTALAVYGDADGSTASNVFLYCLDGDVLRRGRAGTASSASYTCGNGEIVAENVSSLRFNYFDESGSPVPDPPTAPYALDGQGVGSVPALTDTAERAVVRRVVVELTTEIEAIGADAHTYTLTSDIELRNLN